MRKRYLGSVNVDVDVDLDDILFSMSRSEKQDLFDELKDDLDIQDVVGGDEVVIGTMSEQELFNTCNKIYENRNSLTDKDKSILYQLSKKGWYDEILP